MHPVDPLPEVAVEGDAAGAKRPSVLRRPAPVVAAPPLPEAIQRKANVTFGRRMLKQRMQPLVVTIQDVQRDGFAPGRDGVLTVQPVVPGALVTPALADVSTNPGSSARFSVLPLVAGKLRDARVELRYRGKTVESTPMPMKVTRRRFAKGLLLFALIFTAVLAYDRHVTRWEPSFTEEVPTKFAPPPPPPGVTPSATLPPWPKPGEEPYKDITYRGQNAVDKWIEVNRKKAVPKWESGSAEISDVCFMGMYQIAEWKFFPDEETGQPGYSVFRLGFMCWETLRNIPMAEFYVGAALFGIALIVWFMSGASRSRRTSKGFELAIA